MDKIFNLEGKLAVITGATEGIGKSIAQIFYNRGADIVIVGRNKAKLEKTCMEIAKGPNKCKYISCDLSKREEVNVKFRELVKEYPNLDILVNNAGIYKENKSTYEIGKNGEIDLSQEVIEDVINTNFMSYWIGSLHVEEAMKKNKKGCIINISSVNGISGKETCDIYDLTKAGINNLTLNQAKRLAKYNIRANAICPSSTITNMRNKAMAEYPPVEGREKFDKWEASTVPFSRLGNPEDIAYCALWLASDEGSYTTGQTISVDGGYLLFRKSPSSLKG